MLGFFKKDTPGVGSVFFRGNLPPRAEEFDFPRRDGFEVRVMDAGPEEYWSMKVKHPTWGAADIVCLREIRPPPKELIQYVQNLSEREKHDALAAGPAVTARVEATRTFVLRDRKNLLRYLSALMGREGVVAADHSSELFWSRAALDDELAHDADLDIEALYCIHAVTDDREDLAKKGEGSTEWMHTHGLDRLGGFDVDILRPSPSLVNGCSEIFRALAFAIAEGHLRPDTARFALAHPGGDVRLVPAAEFQRLAEPSDRAVRGDYPGHSANRAVLCDPVGGLFARWTKTPRPSRFLSTINTDRHMVSFTTSASELMAERARNTLPVFRALMAEMTEFEFPGLVKLGFRVDGGAENDKEHMWFQVHALEGASIDATLVNRPFKVARLKEGDRGKHPVDLLSDWTVVTPAGQVTPRSMTAARLVRERKDELRAMMKRAQAQGVGG